MAHAVKVIYSLKDNKGKISTTTVHLPVGKTAIDYLEFAIEMGTLIRSVTTGAISNVSVVLEVDITGESWSTAGATSDVEEKGKFQFVTNGIYYTGVALPTFSDLLVLDGSDSIDLTDADVIAFVDAMVDGITLPVATTQMNPCDSREDDIEGLIYARERFMASGRRP